MRILITGADVQLTDKSDLDITNLSAIRQNTMENKVSCIINCARYTAVDKAEGEPAIAKLVNVDGARNLGRKITFIYIPVSVGLFFVSLFNFLGVKFPLKDEQIKRMEEDRAFEHKEAENDFIFPPVTFEEGIRFEIAELRSVKQL